MKIKYSCEVCKGDKLEFDAVVSWDYENQKYIFHGFGDRAWCADCGTDQHYKQEVEND